MDPYFTSLEMYGTDDTYTSTSYETHETVGTSHTFPDIPTIEEMLTATNDASSEEDSSDGEIEGDEPAAMTFMDAPVPDFDDASLASNAMCTDWESSQLCDEGEITVGMEFESKEELVNHVKRWHIATGRSFRRPRSDTKYVAMKCESEGCPWYIRGMFVKQLQSWKITVADHMHICQSKRVHRYHRQLSSSFVADYIFPLVAADIGLKVSVIMASVKQKYNYEISYPLAWQAKQKVLERLFGTHEEAFPKLPRLLNALQQSNRGTCVQFEHKRIENGKATFGMVFWAFGAAIEGFRHCRPLIAIDGTHLYGKYQGKLLVGVAYDANNGLFPLCYALADSESNESWTFFLSCLRQYVTPNREGICLLSDRHRAIIHAVDSVFPEPVGFHRFCVRHLASNFNKEFKCSTTKAELDKMARTPSKTKFDVWYDRFCKLGTDGDYKRWIERIPKEKWALAYDDGHRFGNMTTNMVEIYNSVLKSARGLPVTALVLLTYFRTNKYFVERRQDGQAFLNAGHIWPFNVRTKIDHATNLSVACDATVFDWENGEFLVRAKRCVTPSGSLRPGNYTVIMDNGYCSCGEWQLYGRPCPHLVAACKLRSVDVDQYVSYFLTVAAYVNTYSPRFHPIPDEMFWPEWNGPNVVGDPRRFVVKRGHRKSTRIHNEMDGNEGRNSITCGRCHQDGHNRRTCRAEL